MQKEEELLLKNLRLESTVIVILNNTELQGCSDDQLMYYEQFHSFIVTCQNIIPINPWEGDFEMCQMSNLLENAEMYISSTCSTALSVIAQLNNLFCPVLDSNSVKYAV